MAGRRRHLVGERSSPDRGSASESLVKVRVQAVTRGAAWHGESLVKVRVQAVTRGAARRTFQASDRTSGRSRTDLTPACIFFLPLVMERAGFRHLLTLDAAADARPVLLRRKLLLGFLEVPLRPAHAPASADECQIRRRPPPATRPTGCPFGTVAHTRARALAPRAHAHTHAHAHTRTRAHAHAHTRTHAHTHTRAHTRTRTHTHVPTRARTPPRQDRPPSHHTDRH